MAKLSTAQIKAVAKQKLAQVPEGIRWTKLVNEIKAEYPETPINTIWGCTNSLFKEDTDVVKVSRGIYALASTKVTPMMSGELVESGGAAELQKPTYEKDFYQPFAEWLRDGLEEVTEALAIGGNIFKGKWATPDVIGVLRPMRGDPVKFEPQIVSAEVKTDPSQPVIAFGQAISYRLFSHKSYLVLPNSISDDDLDRMIALSTTFGLGLVTFSVDVDNPDFKLEVRATLSSPDMVYVNQMATQLNAYDKKGFDRLF
jgi:hypothetical protein